MSKGLIRTSDITREDIADLAASIYPDALAQVWPRHEVAIRTLSPAMADHIANEGVNEVEDDQWYFVFANPLTEALEGCGSGAVKAEYAALDENEQDELHDICADFKDALGDACRELLPE